MRESSLPPVQRQPPLPHLARPPTPHYTNKHLKHKALKNKTSFLCVCCSSLDFSNICWASQNDLASLCFIVRRVQWRRSRDLQANKNVIWEFWKRRYDRLGRDVLAAGRADRPMEHRRVHLCVHLVQRGGKTKSSLLTEVAETQMKINGNKNLKFRR